MKNHIHINKLIDYFTFLLDFFLQQCTLWTGAKEAVFLQLCQSYFIISTMLYFHFWTYIFQCMLQAVIQEKCREELKWTESVVVHLCICLHLHFSLCIKDPFIYFVVQFCAFANLCTCDVLHLCTNAVVHLYASHFLVRHLSNPLFYIHLSISSALSLFFTMLQCEYHLIFMFVQFDHSIVSCLFLRQRQRQRQRQRLRPRHWEWFGDLVQYTL